MHPRRFAGHSLANGHRLDRILPHESNSTGKPRLGLSGELRTAHDHGNLGYTLSSAASTLFGREPSPQLCTLSAALHYSRVSSNFFARQWHAALACAGFGSGVTPNETR